jgi:hypothetical protein
MMTDHFANSLIEFELPYVMLCRNQMLHYQPRVNLASGDQGP